MKFTLSEAALQVGLSKTSIHKAVKSGRLSAVRDGRRYQIEASELFRVYPMVTKVDDEKRQLSLPIDTVSSDVKDMEIRMLRELLDAKDETIRLQSQQIESQQKLLFAPAREPTARPSLWLRLFGQ